MLELDVLYGAPLTVPKDVALADGVGLPLMVVVLGSALVVLEIPVENGAVPEAK